MPLTSCPQLRSLEPSPETPLPSVLLTVLRRGWLRLPTQVAPSLDHPTMPSSTFLCLDYFSSFLNSREALSPPGCLFCIFHPRLDVSSLCSSRPFCKNLHSLSFRWSGDLCGFYRWPGMQSSQRVRGCLSLSPISWRRHSIYFAISK